MIGKKFKELNLTNIYAPPLPSLALPSLPMTSWVSMLLGDQDFLHPFPPTRNFQDHGQELLDASALSFLASIDWSVLLLACVLWGRLRSWSCLLARGLLVPDWKDHSPQALPPGHPLCSRHLPRKDCSPPRRLGGSRLVWNSLKLEQCLDEAPAEGSRWAFP